MRYSFIQKPDHLGFSLSIINWGVLQLNLSFYFHDVQSMSPKKAPEETCPHKKGRRTKTTCFFPRKTSKRNTLQLQLRFTPTYDSWIFFRWKNTEVMFCRLSSWVWLKLFLVCSTYLGPSFCGEGHNISFFWGLLWGQNTWHWTQKVCCSTVQGLYKPIQGSCAIYFYPGVCEFWCFLGSFFFSHCKWTWQHEIFLGVMF